MDPVMKAALQRDKVTIDPSLRLYIPFNEGVGNVAKDYSQYGNNGVFTDVEWGVQGGVFNGTSSFVNCGNDSSLDITDAITCEAWVKIAGGAGTHRYILSKGDYNQGPYMEVADGDAIQVEIQESDGTRHYYVWGSATSFNTWYHIVHTYNNANGMQYLFINGEYISRDIGSFTIKTNSINLGIGTHNIDGPGCFFNGTIAGVKIYNRALSALEILNTYEAERGRYGV